MKWNFSIFLVMIFMFLLPLLCSKSDKNSADLQTQNMRDKKSSSKDAVKTIDSLDELFSIVENTPGKLLVFDIYADWCKPCLILSPIFSRLASDYSKRALFFRINIQNNPEIASAFRVQSIPLVVFMKDKEVVYRVTGLREREEYERVITTCGHSSVSPEECKAMLNQNL